MIKVFENFKIRYYEFEIINHNNFFKYIVENNIDIENTIDLSVLKYNTFDAAINNVINNISYDFAINEYNIIYKINKYSDSFIPENAIDDFEIWKESKKYNL